LDSFVLLIFLIPFHSSAFNLLGIVLYHFSMYNASSLMTRVTGLKSWHGSISFFSYFFFLSWFHRSTLFFIKKNWLYGFLWFFFIELSWSHDLNYEFCRLPWVNSLFITYITCSSHCFGLTQTCFILSFLCNYMPLWIFSYCIVFL